VIIKFIEVLGEVFYFIFEFGWKEPKENFNKKVKVLSWDGYIELILLIIYTILSIAFYSFVKINILLYVSISFVFVLFFTIVTTKLISNMILKIYIKSYKEGKKNGKFNYKKDENRRL
jgi:hypothetical protein